MKLTNGPNFPSLPCSSSPGRLASLVTGRLRDNTRTMSKFTDSETHECVCDGINEQTVTATTTLSPPQITCLRRRHVTFQLTGWDRNRHQTIPSEVTPRYTTPLENYQRAGPVFRHTT